MKVSKVATSTARRIFRLCSPDGKMNEEHLRAAIQKIGSEKPRDFRGILHVLRRLVQAEASKKAVIVESAVALDVATSENLTNSLREKHGQDLTFEFKTTPDLLGGLRVQVGDNVYDSSVKSRLNRLSESF